MDTARGVDSTRPPRFALPSPLVALEFLTVLRLRPARVVSSDAVARALLWYPAIGLLLGLGLAGLDRLLQPRLPRAPEAALLLLALESATGLLHLDGLADCADGLLGLHERERRLTILKDSRTGAFGVVAIGFYLLLAWSAIGALAGPARAATLIAAPAASRSAMVVVAFFPLARPGGLAQGFQAAARSPLGAGALLFAIGVALVVFGAGGLALLAVAFVGGALVAVFASARLGGVTGDVFGAACECAQLAVLLCACAWQGWLRPWL